MGIIPIRLDQYADAIYQQHRFENSEYRCKVIAKHF